MVVSETQWALLELSGGLLRSLGLDWGSLRYINVGQCVMFIHRGVYTLHIDPHGTQLTPTESPQSLADPTELPVNAA